MADESTDIRSCTFRGRVVAVERMGDAQVATVAVGEAHGAITIMRDVCSADVGSHNINPGNVVLVRARFADGEAVHADIVARSLFADADVDTTDSLADKIMSGEVEKPGQAIAPIVEHRTVRSEGEDRQLVTCVVYEPGRMDKGWNTTASPETVESWAHGYMIGNIGLRGETITDDHWLKGEDGDYVLRDPDLGDTIEDGRYTNRLPAVHLDAYVVESWIKRCDCPINGQAISAGAWMIEVWIRDQEAWQRVLSGEYSGVSIEAYKLPIDMEV